ncbi:XkdW family protein [Paenibacillus medicaginis]|uniref:XkdW family protein n=1 Tax=Paenibacillus medicaginis TaxID=1470560 RepID=A0ABV5C0I4_9BACL
MIKDVVVLDGQVINIGPWDEQIRPVLVSPPEHDDEGNVTKEAVYEDRVTNPMPEGAVIEQREIETAPDGGLIVKGTAKPSETELLGQQLATMKLQAMQQTATVNELGQELAAAKLELINLKGAEQV